jgi:hypothetical protein
LPLTPTSFLLSLRTMVDYTRAGDLQLRVLFRTPEDALLAELTGRELRVDRYPAPVPKADIEYSAASVTNFLGVLYGKRPAAECGVTVTGDALLAARFADLFTLPEKCPLTKVG